MESKHGEQADTRSQKQRRAQCQTDNAEQNCREYYVDCAASHLTLTGT